MPVFCDRIIRADNLIPEPFRLPGGRGDDFSKFCIGAIVMIDKIKEVSLFKGLSESELGLLSKIIDRQSYASDETIFMENARGKKLYVVESGKVRISIKVSSGGENQTLAILSSGDFFGELSFLDDLPHSATASVLKECTVWSFSKDDFDELAENNPQEYYTILHRIASNVCHLLRQMDEKYIDMVKFVWEFGAKS